MLFYYGINPNFMQNIGLVVKFGIMKFLNIAPPQKKV